MAVMRKKGMITLVLAAGLLAGCSGGVGKMLGLEKEAPDEFKVVSRAPLTVPTDVSLRPPDPNARRDNEISVREEAEQLLFDTKHKEKLTNESRQKFRGGELALLTRADALAVDPAIRRVVDDESSALALESDTFVRKIMFWKGDEPAGTVIDASAEAQRIQENTGLGNPVTDGDTPMIRREKNDSLLGGFKWPF